MGEIRVGLVSLGCAKNLVDSEVMLGFLQKDGFVITTDPTDADVLLVNTCGFIEPAKQESINAVLEMAGHKQTGRCRVLAVSGCLSKRYAAELKQEIPEIDVLVGVAEYPDLPRLIRAALQKQPSVSVTTDSFLYDETMPRVRATPPYMAYVKIAEGCRNRCRYCVIPDIRGPLTSRPMESIENEVRQLALEGVVEVNVIAQDTSAYGMDLYGEPSLARLAGRLARIEGVKWLRLFYAYPSRVNDELLAVMASSPAICRYLDIPLQHAHRDILRSMGRPGDGEGYLEMIARVRAAVPGIALRSSFIVGYPGETDAHFETLLGFLRSAAIDHAGVFTYSAEEGTPASLLPGQVPERVKRERFEAAMEVQRDVSRKVLAGRVGSITDMLVTYTTAQGLVAGRTPWQGPEVDGETFMTAIEGIVPRPGELIRVRITGGRDYDLRAQPESEQ